MTYRIWITLFMFWFCAIPHLGSAQETGQIEGRVVNAAKQPIPGVDVEIVAPHPPLKTTTNANGRYRFDGLLPGQYSITAAHSGYKTGIYRQVQILDQETVVLDFLLVPAPVLQDKIVVSASRKEEKLLDAPASVVVVSKEDLVHENNQTVIEHMKHQPSVDYVQTGLTQTNVVARGFNNVASGALLSFVDNRISRLPSLRFNTHNFIPLTVDDIDRIELVLGPASALYGPESASGVLHIITRSPFDSEGTMLHSGGGERNMRTFYARHAKVLNDKMAYKLSAGHYFARDWKYEDAEEIRLRGFNPRNENIERTTGDLRLDLKPMKDLSLFF